MAATEVLYNSDPIAAVPGGLVIPTNRTRGKVVERAYFVGDDGTFSIRIVDPEMQGKFKIGDRVDLLGGLKGK